MSLTMGERIITLYTFENVFLKWTKGERACYEIEFGFSTIPADR